MVEVDLQFVLGLIGGGITVYLIVKYRLHQVRVLLDNIDDAIKDDKVTEEEFRAIFAAGKAIFVNPPK